MGQTGSFTAQPNPGPLFLPITRWDFDKLRSIKLRSDKEFGDIFALRRQDFHTLLGKEDIEFYHAKNLFEKVFDKKGAKVIDKLQVICSVCLVSTTSSEAKVSFLFDLFDFNKKGYLLESEISLLFHTIVDATLKIDSTIDLATDDSVDKLAQESLKHSSSQCDTYQEQLILRKPELLRFIATNLQTRAFIEIWSGHASQVLLNRQEIWEDKAFPAEYISISPTIDWSKLGLPPPSFIFWSRRATPKHLSQPITQTKTITATNPATNINDADDPNKSHVVSSSSRVSEVQSHSKNDEVIKRNRHQVHFDALVGTGALFSHTEQSLKKTNRRMIREGLGALAEGTLKQGLLADGWILNAVAALIGEPYLLQTLFVTTGQEEHGRFCIRLFEKSSWRNVFIDDWLPMAPDDRPLFSHTSDISECWLMLLVKALAKFLGSYGHVARAAERADAMEVALRWFTGGHVTREFVGNYDWLTDETDMGHEGGGGHLTRLRAEGALVALGRSQALSWMPGLSSRLSNRHGHGHGDKHRDHDRDRDRGSTSSFFIPSGRLFPLVDIRLEKSDGFRYLVLRDAWDILPPSKNPAAYDPRCGHCRTFTVKVEEVSMHFDSIYVSRYPDPFRTIASEMGIPAWKSEICTGVNHGVQAPSCFMLIVGDEATQLDTSQSTNIPTPTGISPAASSASLMTASSLVPQPTPSQATSSHPKHVDVVMTINSSADWSEVGNPKLNPKARLLIVPSHDTKRLYFDLMQRESSTTSGVSSSHDSEDDPKMRRSESKIKRFGSNINLKQKSGTNLRSSDQPPSTFSQGQHQHHHNLLPELKDAHRSHHHHQQIKESEKSGEFQYSASRCWLSASVKLLPGTYAVFAEISLDKEIDSIDNESKQSSTRNTLPHPELKAGATKKNPSEEALKDDTTGTANTSVASQQKTDEKATGVTVTTQDRLHSDVIIHVSCAGKIKLQAVDSPMLTLDDNSQPMTFSKRSRKRSSAKSGTQRNFRKTSMRRTKPLKTGSDVGGDRDGSSGVSSGLGVLSENEQSTVLLARRESTFDSESLGGTFAPISDILHHVPNIEKVHVDMERWPFICERQADIASRGLIDMLSRLRMEAELVKAETLAVAAEKDTQKGRFDPKEAQSA